MKRTRLPFLLVVMLAADACAAQSAPPIILHVARGADACRIDYNGRQLTDDQLLVLARSWRGRGVRIEGERNTPYKCIGGTLFTVQRAGVKDVGFSVGAAKE
jgi:hypothetical protein